MKSKYFRSPKAILAWRDVPGFDELEVRMASFNNQLAELEANPSPSAEAELQSLVGANAYFRLSVKDDLYRGFSINALHSGGGKYYGPHPPDIGDYSQKKLDARRKIFEEAGIWEEEQKLTEDVKDFVAKNFPALDEANRRREKLADWFNPASGGTVSERRDSRLEAGYRTGQSGLEAGIASYRTPDEILYPHKSPFLINEEFLVSENVFDDGLVTRNTSSRKLFLRVNFGDPKYPSQHMYLKVGTGDSRGNGFWDLDLSVLPKDTLFMAFLDKWRAYDFKQMAVEVWQELREDMDELRLVYPSRPQK